MLSTINLLVLILRLTIITASQYKCEEYPNWDTKAFTYTVCTDTYATDLNTTREFCKKEVNNSDIITFPSQKEYLFVQSTLNKTFRNQEFKYMIGIFQKKGNDVFAPQTGEFYWVTDPYNKITNESSTYWQPIQKHINMFKSLTPRKQYVSTFLLDAKGELHHCRSVAGGVPTTPLEGDVICMRKGVPTQQMITPAQKQINNIDYHIIIVACAAVIVGAVIFIVVGYCIYKKRQKFHKVPQDDISKQPSV